MADCRPAVHGDSFQESF